MHPHKFLMYNILVYLFFRFFTFLSFLLYNINKSYFMMMLKQILYSILSFLKSPFGRLMFSTNHKCILQSIFVMIFCIIIPYFCPYFVFYKDYLYLYNFCCYLLWVLLVYNFVYNRCNLEKSIVSFFCFYLNILFITFMLWSILNVINGMPSGIYLNNLTFVTGLRYLIMIFIVIIGCILFVCFKISTAPVMTNVYNKLMYPYLQMEVLKLLRIFEDTFFGKIFQRLIVMLSYNNLLKYFIFSLHFLVSYVISFIQLLVLINFTFFSGDLRLLFYLMPLFLFSWVFKSLWFYFVAFITDNSDSIRQVLQVTYKGNLTPTKNNIVMLDESLLDFQLVKPTDNISYNTILLAEYKEIYITFGKITAYIIQYNATIYLLPYILLSFRFFCWCFIVFSIFV